MIKLKINIPKDVNNLIHRLQDNGFEAYICGGAVRDSILNREIHDYDICTSATPTEMLQIFSNERVIETGLQHGTLTVMKNGVGYEITTFRCDGDYSDGRHPDSVKFVTDIKEDLSRRDFTINAMAYNDEVGLINPFGGLKDIENKLIRCVGNPKDRFNEDALRIMRAIRFAAQLDFTIEDYTIRYLEELKDNLSNISMERINSEFCKILMNDPLILYVHLDIVNVFISEDHSFTKSSIRSFIYAMEHNFDLIEMLTLYFGCHFINDVSNILHRMKFDNKTIKEVMELLLYFNIEFKSKVEIKHLLNAIGEYQVYRLIRINRSFNKDMRNQIILYNEILLNNECYSLKQLAINGQDLIQLGFKPGEEIGKVLNASLENVINGLPNKKETLLGFAKMKLEVENDD